MSTLIQSQPRLIVVACPGQTPGFSFGQLYKAGLPVAVSDGAITENGDDSVTVSFDAADTDTVGDFTFSVKDGATGKYWSVGNDVWNSPIGLVPNDGTGSVLLDNVALVALTSVPALKIQATTVGNDAVEIISADDGITITTDGRGVAIDAISTGLEIVSDHSCIVSDGVNGWLMTASNFGVAITLTGTGDAVRLESSAGVGFNSIGGDCGIAARCSDTLLPGILRTGMYVAAHGDGLRVRSLTGNGVFLTGLGAGLNVFAAGGPAVIWGVIDGLVAIADKVLNLADGVETGRTLGWAMRIILAAAAGKSFLTGAVRTYRDTNDTTNRVSATTDNFGQRTAVTYNG